MNRSFQRLVALLEPMGIRFDEGGISRAEMRGYSAGIALVEAYITAALAQAFSENINGAKRYAALLNIDASRFTATRLSDEIRRRLSMNFATATVTEMETAFENVGSGSLELYHDNGEILATMKFTDVEADDLTELGRFIESYACLSNRLGFDGSGLDFDGWGLWGQSFYKLDKMNLPFKIFDELRSDMIEQHE